MIPKTTDIYISIAKIQAKRRDNWFPGVPLDWDLEKEHLCELEALRKKLEATQGPVIIDLPVKKEQFSMINFMHRIITRLFTRKSP